MKEKIYKISPHFIQNIMISLFNIIANRKRYGKKYNYYFNFYNAKRNATLLEIKELQENYLRNFLNFSKTKTVFYKDIDLSVTVDSINKLPILHKEDLRKNINDIYTIPKSSGVVSKTGGTTGKSLEVIFTKENMQERFAILDLFRGQFGYKLGEKTAWFSGKNLLNNRDLKKNRFWKTDHLYNVRYYSTFHIKESYLKFYIKNLIIFKPKYMVGFPSNMLEIAIYGIKNDITFPKGIVKAIFPTAETITPYIRQIIESYFHCGVYDQYASSEGAPFIIECKNKNLHLELLSGVFEVLDDKNEPAKSGKLVVTSFTTYGTPLIRYDIGDSITLSDDRCNCGNNNPLVKEILGRIDDYIFSPQTGKINLGNISNTLKNTKGIVKFQVIQNELTKIEILMVIDRIEFDEKSKKTFLKNWITRVGDAMQISLIEVDDISVEHSGKFRIVKNNIKHLLN